MQKYKFHLHYKIYTKNYLNIKEQPVEFIANITDPDNDPVTAKICSNRQCDEVLCIIGAENTQQTGYYTNCIYTTGIAGIHQYYLVAEDSNGLKTTTNAHVFEIRESASESHDVANASVEIIASSYLPQETPGNVLEDNTSYWTSNSLPAWLVIDLNKTTAVKGFGIFSESPARPKGYSIGISRNCVNYTTVYFTNNAQYKSGWVKEFFPAVDGKCVRLYITASESSADYASVALFEVYKSETPSQIQGTTMETNASINITSTQEYNISGSIAEQKPDYALILIIIIAVIIIILVVLFRNAISRFISQQKLKMYYNE